ncbi:MAG: hypothetical protein WKF57_14170 [Nakamurella sp.]
MIIIGFAVEWIGEGDNSAKVSELSRQMLTGWAKAGPVRVIGRAAQGHQPTNGLGERNESGATQADSGLESSAGVLMSDLGGDCEGVQVSS